MIKPTPRRSFLKTGAAAAGAFTALSASRVIGANDTINMGFIGLGGRGAGSASWFNKIDGVRVMGLCDPDPQRVDQNKKKYEGSFGAKDLRKIIENDDIDAVCISTCNHWHALAAIWAAQAGKDVYVEKPVSHNVWEGRKMVEAARKYNVIMQGGTQQRSDPVQDEIKAFLDSGELGKIKYARLNRYGLRGSIGKRNTPLKPPDNVDYDLWLGPAQDLPMYREKFHYDWHWIWNTGNGELGNWGPHITDDLRNIVFRDGVKLPKRVVSGGGRLAWDDAGESPNTHFVYFDTGDIPVIMDVHNLPRQKGMRAGDVYKRRRTGGFMVIECEDGYYAGGRGGGSFYTQEGKAIKKFKGDGGGNHAQNFIDACRSRKRADLKADIEEIHYSSAWCHLGNISYQLAQKDYKRKRAEKLVDHQAWSDVIEDFHNHMQANEIDIANEKVMLGPMLNIDGDKETFTGDTATPEALAMLRREYRKGFEINDEV